MAKQRNRAFEDTVAVGKALADEQRVRILMALSRGELCLCQLTELLGLAPSTVSKHASILKQARLVRGRREGRWTMFRLAEEEYSAEAPLAIAWLGKALAKSPEIRDDARRLAEIKKTPREELCKS